MQERERVLVDEEDGRRGLVERLAGGHDVELVERQERADHADQRDQQDRPAGQRHGHPSGPLPEGRPVDHRRLVDLARDGLDRGDEQDHAEPEDLPDDRRDDRPGRDIGVHAEELDRLVDEPEVSQRLVDEPERRVEQPDPQEARHAEADDDRHEDDRPRRPTQRRVGRDQQGEQVARRPSGSG